MSHVINGIFQFLCIGVFCLSYLRHVRAVFTEARRLSDALELELNICKIPGGPWELNVGSLQEQPVLLMAEL